METGFAIFTLAVAGLFLGIYSHDPAERTEAEI